MDEISSWLCAHHFPVLKSVRKPWTEDTNRVFGEKKRYALVAVFLGS